MLHSIDTRPTKEGGAVFTHADAVRPRPANKRGLARYVWLTDITAVLSRCSQLKYFDY